MEDFKMSKGVAIGIFIVIVAILVYITINHTSTETPVPSTDAAALSLQGIMDSNTEGQAETGGVQVAVLQEGAGVVAISGDVVAVNYTGTLADGTVFDSNVDPKFGHAQALQFSIGAGDVIPGLELGVTGMKVGEKRKVKIAPDLAYGPADYGPIPGGSTLVFEVELLKIN